MENLCIWRTPIVKEKRQIVQLHVAAVIVSSENPRLSATSFPKKYLCK